MKHAVPKRKITYILTKSDCWWPFLFLSTGHGQINLKNLTDVLNKPTKLQIQSIPSSWCISNLPFNFFFHCQNPRQGSCYNSVFGSFNYNTWTRKSKHFYSSHIGLSLRHSLGLIFVPVKGHPTWLDPLFPLSPWDSLHCSPIIFDKILPLFL